MEQLQRAISIRQPYADLILQGLKRHEYRSRATTIRGRVYVYAAKKLAFGVERSACGLPRGVIVGSIEILSCDWQEDFQRYAYLLAAPVRYPISVKPLGQPQPLFWFPKFATV